MRHLPRKSLFRSPAAARGRCPGCTSATMGESVKIIDLAEQIIKFSGLEPYKDIEIKIIGCREGERTTEPLWLEKESPRKTNYEKVLELHNMELSENELNEIITLLKPICFYDEKNADFYRNKELLIQILRKHISSLDEFYKKSKTLSNGNL